MNQEINYFCTIDTNKGKSHEVIEDIWKYEYSILKLTK